MAPSNLIALLPPLTAEIHSHHTWNLPKTRTPALRNSFIISNTWNSLSKPIINIYDHKAFKVSLKKTLFCTHCEPCKDDRYSWKDCVWDLLP